MFFADITAMTGWELVLFIVIAIWELVWKGIALWHSARNKQTPWFIVMLVLNTVGILPIIYLLWFRADRKKKAKKGRR